MSEEKERNNMIPENSTESPEGLARSKNRKEALEWLDYADGDCATAHYLSEAFFHPRKLEIICYHCSQAAEKQRKRCLWISGVLVGCHRSMTSVSFLTR